MRRTVALPALILLVAGCGRYADRLTAREVVVSFDRVATQGQHDAARRACSGLPRTSPEPAPRSTLAAGRAGDVRFRVDRADDADLARLFDCLGRQPGVRGVSPPQELQ